MTIVFFISVILFTCMMLYLSFKRNDRLYELEMNHWMRWKFLEMKTISEHISDSVNRQFFGEHE